VQRGHRSILFGLRRPICCLFVYLVTTSFARAEAPSPPGEVVADPATLWRLVDAYDGDAIAALGTDVLPRLAEMYRQADEEGRARLAAVFYQLGWKSEELRELLMADLETRHEALRIRVQWALGRVSNDDVVVEALLDTMVHDPNPLFRDKAGCGLAYDQIHLTEPQKLALYRRLVELMDSGNPETRSLASRVLEAHTGQWKGYHAGFPEAKRRESLESWRAWLEEYAAQLP
jgi:hypothetical protein